MVGNLLHHLVTHLYKRPTPKTPASEMNALSLPATATSVVVRPFGSVDAHRPDSFPQTPVSQDRKRKMFAVGDYDWTEHQNAPIRPYLVARPLH